MRVTLAAPFIAALVLAAPHSGACLPVNGDFSSGLTGWAAAGDVTVEDSRAVLHDKTDGGTLYQAVPLEPGQYLLQFDFLNALSVTAAHNTFHDAFFASLYFVNAASFDPSSPPQTFAALFDMDYRGARLLSGTSSASPLGGAWRRYSYQFASSSWYAVPVFDIDGLNGASWDSSVRVDNVSLAPVCDGTCSSQNPDRDEDGDGVPNCMEIDDETLPCDSGSFIEKLQPWACAGPNGFFGQVNIASILNRQAEPLFVRTEYRDFTGELKGGISFTLQPQEKRDVIVNELGLEPDTYGTLCVYTGASAPGGWGGGLVIYKERSGPSAGFHGGETFDFALHYPFSNPKRGRQTVSINTYAINEHGMVANWLRINDAVHGDGRGLTGELRYFNAVGEQVGVEEVNIPDAGRYDSPGHTHLGPSRVGLVDFTPSSPDDEYYLEMSRYHYEGNFGETSNFYTAYTVPVRPMTSAEISSRISTNAGETAVVEIVNSAPVEAWAFFRLFDVSGNQAAAEWLFVPPRGAYHRVIAANELTPAPGGGQAGSVAVSGGDNRVSAITLGYASNNGYRYASAPPLVESAGRIQYAEFNTYINHSNTLTIANTRDEELRGIRITVYNWDASVISETSIDIPARGTAVVPLTNLPADHYGLVRVESSRVGLIVTNEQIRQDQYKLVHAGS